MNETFTVERLVGGAIKVTSDSAWMPGGVMVVRSGEQFTLEIPGMGVTTVSLVTILLEDLQCRFYMNMLFIQAHLHYDSATFSVQWVLLSETI